MTTFSDTSMVEETPCLVEIIKDTVYIETQLLVTNYTNTSIISQGELCDSVFTNIDFVSNGIPEPIQILYDTIYPIRYDTITIFEYVTSIVVNDTSIVFEAIDSSYFSVLDTITDNNMTIQVIDSFLIEDIFNRQLISIFEIDQYNATTCQATVLYDSLTNTTFDLIQYSGLDTTFISQSEIIITSNNNYLDHSIRVFPNPSNGKIRIATNDNMQINSITVHNSMGLLVYEALNFNSPTFDLNIVEAGYYYFSIQTNQGLVNKPIIIIDNP
jgi:hypothetical protein